MPAVFSSTAMIHVSVWQRFVELLVAVARLFVCTYVLLVYLQERIASPKWQNIELMMSVLFEQMQHAVDQRYVLVDAYGQSFKQLMTTIAVRVVFCMRTASMGFVSVLGAGTLVCLSTLWAPFRNISMLLLNASLKIEITVGIAAQQTLFLVDFVIVTGALLCPICVLGAYLCLMSARCTSSLTPLAQLAVGIIFESV